MTDEQRAPQRLLRKRLAKAMFGGVSDSTWHSWIVKGLIPPPLKLGPDRSRHGVALWREDELAAIQQEMFAARDKLVEQHLADMAAHAAAMVASEPQVAGPQVAGPVVARGRNAERDQRIVALAAKGVSKADIAAQLGISAERVRQILIKQEVGP
jgi:hypothetical protein